MQNTALAFSTTVEGELSAFLKTIQTHSSRKVAVFDADGTLWHGDLGENFFRDQIRKGTLGGPPKIPNGQDLWTFYKTEEMHGDSYKAYGWLAQWNAGMNELELKQQCRDFFKAHYQPSMFEPMKKWVKQLQAAQVEIWIVSGSPKWAVQAGAEILGVDLDKVIGTSVHVRQGVLTDEIEHIPYRAHKARLIEEKIGVTPLFAAGNTFWDKEMLWTSSHLSLAIRSEQPGEPNFESEEKLEMLVKKESQEGHTQKTMKKWLTQDWR